MDPSHTGFYRMVQKVSDVIPVLYFVVYRFCFPERRQVRSRMYETDLRTFWHRAIHVGQAVSTGWAQKFEKIRIFDHLQTAYLSNC